MRSDHVRYKFNVLVAEKMKAGKIPEAQGFYKICFTTVTVNPFAIASYPDRGHPVHETLQNNRSNVVIANIGVHLSLFFQ